MSFKEEWNPQALERIFKAMEKQEVNRDDPYSGFIAGEALMTHLRAEYSAMSPKGEALLSEVGIGIVEGIHHLYGEFIDEGRKEVSVGVVDRLLCMESDDFYRFNHYWHHPSSEDEPDETEVVGTFHSSYGRVVVFKSIPVPDFSQMTEEQREQLEEFGGVAKATSRIMTAYLLNLLTHEILHEYSDRFFREFSEAGTDYYAQEVSAVFGLPYGRLVGYGDAPKNFYGELVEKYGEDMHRLYFGSEIDWKTRRNILAEFTSEKRKELFPEKAGNPDMKVESVY